jgi:methanethiol S-methyltransferase
MAGFVIVFWAAPVMTAGHLLFAAAATGYILVGIWFEERDLVRSLGGTYTAYLASVPALTRSATRMVSSWPLAKFVT